MEPTSTRGQNSPEYEQPVLPLPEFEQINQEPARAEQTVIFNSLREYTGAWREAIRARRKHTVEPENTQLSFEYPPHPETEVTSSSDNKTREQLETLKTKQSFYAALGERALKIVAGNGEKAPEAPRPTSAFQRHVAHKTEKKIRQESERVKIQKWNDAFFGTDRGQVADIRGTKRAKRQRRRELKQAYKDGIISVDKLEDGLKANLKTVVLKDTAERAAEKRRAEKSVTKLRKIATQPTITRRLDDKVSKLSKILGEDETTSDIEVVEAPPAQTTEPSSHTRQEGNTFIYEKGTLFKPENAKKFDESFFRKNTPQKRRKKTDEERGPRKDRQSKGKVSPRANELTDLIEDIKPKFHHYFNETALLSIDAAIKPVMDDELRNLPVGTDMSDVEKDDIRLSVIRRELGEDADEDGLAESIRDAIRTIRLPKKKTTS